MNKKTSISVRYYFDLEDIANLLDSASGGSTYWGDGVEMLQYQSVTDSILYDEDSEETVTVDIKGNGKKEKALKIADEQNEPMEYLLTLTKIKSGLRTLSKKYPQHFANFLAEDYDMITGDVFLQCCLFGKIKYS